MIKYFTRRLFNLVVILWIMSLAAFLAVRFIPGDPVMAMLGDRRITRDIMDSIRHQYGLDLPVWKQYINYMWGILHWNFGLSYFEIGEPVTEIISSAFKVTLTLSLLAFPIIVVIGISLGIAAAFYKDSAVDTVVSFFSVLATAVPNITIGITLVYIFALKLHLFPVAGWGEAKDVVLPVILISTFPLASLARQTRACIIEELSKDYIITAKSKGVSRKNILFRHAFPNTLLPLTTSTGLIFGRLLEGSFITEILFNIPGLGRISVESISRRDYPVVVAVILLATLIYGLLNILVDISYYIFNPVMSKGGSSGC